MGVDFQRFGAGARVLARWLTGLLLFVSLGGCASVFSAQVSRYQQWPADAAGASYWIEADAAQQNNLQFETFSDSVRAALGPTGLVEASTISHARFIVHMDYSSPRERIVESRPVDPYFYPGPFYGPWHRGYGYGYGYGFGPMVQDVAVVVYRPTLAVRIDDQAQNGREVYRATALATTRRDQLGAAMPYLARAIFDRFPGRNGEVIRVQYPLK